MAIKERLIELYGEEGYLVKIKEWGAKGGRAKVPKGLSKMHKTKLKEVTVIGGKKGKRKY